MDKFFDVDSEEGLEESRPKGALIMTALAVSSPRREEEDILLTVYQVYRALKLYEETGERPLIAGEFSMGLLEVQTEQFMKLLSRKSRMWDRVIDEATVYVPPGSRQPSVSKKPSSSAIHEIEAVMREDSDYE